MGFKYGYRILHIYDDDYIWVYNSLYLSKVDITIEIYVYCMYFNSISYTNYVSMHTSLSKQTHVIRTMWTVCLRCSLCDGYRGINLHLYQYIWLWIKTPPGPQWTSHKPEESLLGCSHTLWLDGCYRPISICIPGILPKWCAPRQSLVATCRAVHSTSGWITWQ